MPVRFLIAAVLAAAWLGSGCATVPEAGKDLVERRAKLFRTQVGDQVTIQWKSEPGIVYGVIYTVNIKDNRSWKGLPGFERIVGNGGQQQLTFTAPVPGKAYYRLRETPVAR